MIDGSTATDVSALGLNITVAALGSSAVEGLTAEHIATFDDNEIEALGTDIANLGTAAMGALTMASPQLYVAEAAAAYDDDAEDFDAPTRKRLQRFLEGFQSWVQLLQGGASRA